MKKEIMDALKAKFVGVSDTILSRVADKLAKTATNAEQVKAAVEAYTIQQLLEGYGDSRATEATQTAVHGYETKYGLKDGKPVDKGGAPTDEPETTKKKEEPAGGGITDMPEWAKALIESNKQMTERLNKMDADRTTASRRMKLNEVISKLPENLRKGYERTAVESINDDEFEKLMGEITTEVEGIVKESNQRGALFGRPTARDASSQTRGNTAEATKDEAKAIADRLVV